MNIEWTHKKVEITDIRKVKKFYVITVNAKGVDGPLFVEHNIFDSRLKSYYLKNSDDKSEFHRRDVTGVKWNMVITKGHFIKYNREKEIEEIQKDPDKFYISFLEIDGPLGTHISN
jgi:hypothetical protein